MEQVSVFVEDPVAAGRRTTRVVLSGVAFVVFMAGCLVLAYSSSLGETASGVALECLSGFIIAVLRDRL